MTRPIPPHGTYARANGSPGYRKGCGCEPCLVARRRGKKRHSTLLKLGRPGKVDAAQARARLLELHEQTGWNDLAVELGASAANLRDIAYGRRNPIRRDTHNKIMALKPTPTGGQYRDALGSRRRIQALRAIGWSAKLIAEAAKTSESRIQLIANGQATVRYSLTVKIRDAYAVLSQAPAPRSPGASRAKSHAAARGWAPPAAWDDDRLDDPTAEPDWTGHCGTDRGWWMHRLQQMSVCARCDAAHEQWKSSVAHLAPSERLAISNRSKAEASNRGANLAHDARELLALDVGIDQAAERLGVTRQHLQQELLRHPAPAVEATAA